MDDKIDYIRRVSTGRVAAASRLSGIRKTAGLSRADIAHVLNVTPAAVAHWESGRRRPRGPAAARLTALLEVLETQSDDARPLRQLVEAVREERLGWVGGYLRIREEGPDDEIGDAWMPGDPCLRTVPVSCSGGLIGFKLADEYELFFNLDELAAVIAGDPALALDEAVA